MNKMQALRFQVRFSTPAFLGNAEQSGQWRTPPFKAQLRQWWRVVYAADHGYQVNVQRMRHDEGLLFGHAWLEDDTDARGRAVAARKSLVRMRVGDWHGGKLTDWNGLEQSPVTHLNVPRPVGPHLYMGYGPLTFDKATRSTALKSNAAVQAGDANALSIAVPQAHAQTISRALSLMHRFGAVGGRSRNGWGSYQLNPIECSKFTEDATPLRAWQDALELDWPHAIGRDDHGALGWQTQPHPGWAPLMRTLAKCKIDLRTSFEFTTGKDAPRTEQRHWLSYPITNHSVRDWGGNARLPNSLRFKVVPAPNQPDMLVGRIFHMPCLPPASFKPRTDVLLGVWKRVHEHLDAAKALQRTAI